MPNGETNLLTGGGSNFIPIIVISLVGGLLDYLYAIQTGKRKWSRLSFLLHLACSVFFGYITALGLVGMDYGVEVVGAGAGAAGFLNIRLIDLIAIYIKHRGDEKKS